jgi:hypothetical protein
MKPRLYLDSSIISYLSARPSRDLIQAARQEVTRRWRDTRRDDFELWVSEVVVRETETGNPEMAARRLEPIEGIPLLPVTEAVIDLAEALVREGPMPQNAADGAFHLALASVHDLDYLLTWNCRHLANAEMVRAARKLLEARGCSVPSVCVPDELLGEE